MVRSVVIVISLSVAVLIYLNLLNAGLALFAGLATALVLRHSYSGFCRKVSAQLLKLSIVGLGFGLNLQGLWQTTQDTFLITFISIAVAIATGVVVFKLMKIHHQTGLLITSGTAICGGSAIAAVSQAIKSHPDRTAMAVTVVFLLNIVALYTFPYIGHWLDLTQYQFGIWAALAIHDTSSVVGAASQYGDASLQIATATKLARTLWIIPVTLLASVWFNGHKSRLNLPVFIVFFVLASAANSAIPSFAPVFQQISEIAKFFLIFALYLLGLGITPQVIKQVDSKPLIMGAILWLVLAVVSLALVIYL
ncbi:YeiH family protein [Pleionea mediterranea]|uniref:Putative integral membrane protein (TIGR00698 family) n=1 Tax=Pleionea mediterranea TaxID=523701 RepID=A0A316FNI3_9GAMM|nr:putative sulfate exporter family transporter [Pleionea mediterranea]PWK49240.1 putative integral membrane protein (TIGR00698 family) [Pleionea mediterranea]